MFDPGIEPETSRTRSKCVSIALYKEFEQELVLIGKIGSMAIKLFQRLMNKCDFFNPWLKLLTRLSPSY